MDVVFSGCTSLPIEVNCLWKYFYGVEEALEVLSMGWRFALIFIPEDEEKLIGFIKVGSLPHYAHKALVCP